MKVDSRNVGDILRCTKACWFRRGSLVTVVQPSDMQRDWLSLAEEPFMSYNPKSFEVVAHMLPLEPDRPTVKKIKVFISNMWTKFVSFYKQGSTLDVQ